ncbi:unnamed protein product [Pieris brassicae]|uniref:Uncharacterized protein n=1 Tax=Pieris brassicae TaxID=7116 RepID=A0A9P0TWB3_PIEBR|nr:unnamed protein product [Pieris brassicae]
MRCVLKHKSESEINNRCVSAIGEADTKQDTPRPALRPIGTLYTVHASIFSFLSTHDTRSGSSELNLLQATLNESFITNLDALTSRAVQLPGQIALGDFARESSLFATACWVGGRRGECLRAGGAGRGS